MSEAKKKRKVELSRRSVIKGLASTGACLLGNNVLATQISLSSETECLNQFVPTVNLAHAYPVCKNQGNSINGSVVLSQSNSGSMANVAAEHRITIGFYSTPIFNGNGENVTRHLLTVDVGSNPSSSSYHPLSDGNFSELNTITDIYIFDEDACGLLYWKQLGGGDTQPSAVFTLDPADVSAQRRLKIVVRCSSHGFWSERFTLSSPQAYSSILPAPNPTLIMAGTSLHRPYSPASGSTDGGQGLGDLHRIRFNILDNDRLTIKIGSGHPHEGSHYIMGGAIFDQNGNLLAPLGQILFSQGTTELGFDRLKLSERGVKTIRGVIFDSLQGYIMSLIDL